MKLSNPCLSSSEIPLLLSGELPPDEAAAAESHISECESCRSMIENMIADSDWWGDARKSLAASAGRLSLSADTPNDTEPSVTAKLLELLDPTDDPEMLGRIGPYEIVGLLGQGGMGAVFKGFDRSLNRFVAIKMLLPHLAASGAARQRFAREAQAVAAVVDDHVMAILCVDEWQGVPYLVMTYSRGVTLQKRLSDNGPLEVREILRIGMQAAKGLAAAHAQGIVHRDIKPANIFLDQSVERVQLMDFGLARAVDDASLTRSGTLTGTPQYMSPEQARAEAVDHRSDLFSLGSVMYAMCTGHAPFRAETSYSVLRLITDKEPRLIREINPDIPEWLCAIISKLMAKQADERFGSANEVAEILEECLAHVQQPQVKPLPEKVAALAPKMVRRPPISKFIGVAAFAFSLLFAGVLVVIELNKGTLTIESDAEDVPIRIMQGEKVVERMTVTKAGNSVRVAAGNYLVELDATMDNMVLENNKVVLSRGSTERVKIRFLPPIDEVKSGDTAAEKPLGPSLPVFDTPESLMKYAADCQNREDVAGYLSCLTDEPVKQLASGYLMISTLVLQDFKNDPDARRPPNYADRMKELEQVIREAVSDKDVAQSALAFATASGQMTLESKGLTSEESANRFMQDPLLHLLANITVDRIKDPRRFIVRFDAIELEDERSKAEGGRKEYDYVVEQDGDKAVATNKSDGNTTGLIKTANGWRINDPWHGITAKDDLEAVPTTTSAQVDDSDPQSLAYATKSYNEKTAELRRSLFQTPIPDLSLGEMREGIRKAADYYRRGGKHQVAGTLQKIAETNRLPDGISMFVTGAHAEDDHGGTLTRQIVPGLILPDNTSNGGHLLTPIRPLELFYRKGGKCSKAYGDEFLAHESSGNASDTLIAGESLEYPFASGDSDTLDDVIESRLSSKVSREEVKKLEGTWEVLEVSFMGQLWNARGAQVLIENGRWVGYDLHESRELNDNIQYNLIIRPDNQFHKAETKTKFRYRKPGRYKLDGDRLWLAVQECSLPSETPVSAIPEVVESNVTYYHLSRKKTNKEDAANQARQVPNIRAAVRSNPQSIESITAVFNDNTAKIRHELFHPPIADLTVDQMKVGLHREGEQQQREGKLKVGKTLQKFADTGILPSSQGRLLGNGTHAVDSTGETISRFIAPTFVLAGEEKEEEELVTITSLALLHEKVGYVSKGYGDLTAGAEPSLSGGDRTIDTREVTNLVKHYDRDLSVNLVAVAPDGKTMAIPSRELADFNSWPTVSIVDVKTGETVRTISPASEEERKLIEQSKWLSALSVTALTYSPDGKKLAIGTTFGQVEIVNPETGERLLTLNDNLNGETENRTKRLRPYPEQGTDDESAAALARLKELKRAMGSITSIAFTSDGLWLATSGGSFEDQPLEFDYTGPLPDPKTGPGRVKIWNAESGKRKFNFDHHLLAGAIAFTRCRGTSSDYFDCLLATAGHWGTGGKRFSGVMLWRTGDGNLVQELRNEDEDFPESIAFSPDSVLLAIGLGHKTNANGETCGIVRMVQPLAGEIWEQKVPISARKTLFIASGNMLAVLCGRPGQEESIQLLDANTGKLNRELKLSDLDHGGAWHDLAYSASEQLLIAVGFDKQQRGSIDVWDFENRRGKD